MAIGVDKTLSLFQQWRLLGVGATVTDTAVTASEDQLWYCRILGGQRRLLVLRGQLTVV